MGSGEQAPRALTHSNHDVPHVRELFGVQEGRQLLPCGHRVPVLVRHPETPLIPSQHFLVGLGILHIVKFFTWGRGNLVQLCRNGGNAGQVEGKDKGSSSAESGQEGLHKTSNN